ncbi:thrombospondin type-1 domain-containing protein 4-like [Xyrauchen texanus]|uniref:thrombospondin type-1 domain-containing protein 4-like n=1 Tax=Xyrauchen texanus TaxID=154827 RepID=UPI0022421957|nr:thrombospondin type-1 domain-containing protein 4-like [Xyrauchen texanus]
MRRTANISVAVVIAVLWLNFTCICAENHRKSGVDTQQRGSGVALSGSWGSWGAWGECSRSCGGGVQEQTRACLPRYGPQSTVAPPRQAGAREWGRDLTVPPHRHTAVENTGSDSSTRADHRLLSVTRYGQRRTNSNRINPGMYGNGRIPHVTPLQKDSGRTSHHRQRQSASNYPHRNTNQKVGQRPVRAPVQQPGSTLHSQLQWNTVGTPASVQTRPYNPLPNNSCPGTPNQHKICNTVACPSLSRPNRNLQCSTFNTQPFMGRLYKWEHFNDVSGEQQCELNCRAIGFRFYVRQADQVIDGTPCGPNDTSVCVTGKCQSVGCDDLLGSGNVRDKCGVCGGDNSACKLVSGLFQHSLSKVGYHKIVEIPQGATKINVTEMVKSRNYLALRSRSGRSIINGNWAIDRPGMYEGVGTMFTYQRPNEISSTTGESFLAEGPTNEILDVYMIYQQTNPGVHYEFIMPSENTGNSQHHEDQQLQVNVVNGQAGYDPSSLPTPEEREKSSVVRYPPPIPDNQLPAAAHPDRYRDYNWKLTGTTDCSTSCGRGSRYTVFGCVHRITHTHVLNGLCDSSTKPSVQEEPCNMQPCPAFWDIGEWSECSKTCGLGMQHRQVLCRQVYANRTLNVHTSRCQHLERPETSTSCQMKICSEWHIRSEWSSCSVPCGVGQRTREVHCVSNVGDIVADDECNMKLRPSDVENCDTGPCTKSWFFSEWSGQCSAECGAGMRTRNVLCITNYISSLPLESCGSQRPPEAQPCNNGPCESRTEWFTGAWSQCSADCGVGSQQRTVVCLMKSDEGFAIMPLYECSSLDRPLSQQSCFIKACGAKWYHTDWSACSKTCAGGYRLREVHCLSDHVITSDSCEETLKPHNKEECNTEPCLPLVDANCQDKYFNCNVVVQARLCVYDYYKMACCASCTRVTQKNSGNWRHT